jgi:hypothetical protein
MQSGFYVNFIFESDPTILTGLRTKFRLNEDVFRVVFTEAGATRRQDGLIAPTGASALPPTLPPLPWPASTRSSSWAT